MADGEFAVGFIRGSFGILGGCKIESASGEYEHIACLKEVTLVKDGVRKSYAVETAEMKGGFLYMKFKGVDSPEQAKNLARSSIVVPRECAKPLKKDEWYIEDLLQCELVYENTSVGIVKNVIEGGGCDLFEVALYEHCEILSHDVKYSADGKLRTVYVPFRKEYIGAVEIEKRRIELLHLWILE